MSRRGLLFLLLVFVVVIVTAMMMMMMMIMKTKTWAIRAIVYEVRRFLRFHCFAKDCTQVL